MENKMHYLIKKSLLLIRNYDYLINSYVLDFYVDNHWDKLPNSWKDTLAKIDPPNLSFLIGSNETSTVWPLSLLAIRTLNKHLCISRDIDEKNGPESTVNPFLELCEKSPKVRNIFTKCVKPKKRHEIDEMAQTCYETAKECNVEYVVDFGAGLGHLARTISYGYGVKVCCLEMQDQLNGQARIIDAQVKTTLLKHSEIKHDLISPVHITWTLTNDVKVDDFLFTIKTAFNIEEESSFSFGIIGLHPCGDLAVILTKLFLQCKEAKFLNIIGCCYMKITTANENSLCSGYPLSNYIKELDKNFTNLSYESREIACHAIEMYHERLKAGNYENLKVHSYRAALERIIIQKSSKFKHYGLRSVKHTPELDFNEYAFKAVKNLKIEVSYEDICTEITANDLSRWKEVVIFYTLRLMLAPLVESVILYDRLVFLRENGCNAVIKSIFDPALSPRNQIIVATKI